jgi:hypothetical protein
VDIVEVEISKRKRGRERDLTVWAPMAHASNASYSGGRDQED